MRYSTVFKFIAVVLCAASLVGMLGSAAGIIAVTELGGNVYRIMSGTYTFTGAVGGSDATELELALELLGAVFVPVEHNCAPEKIASFISRAEAKAVVTVKEKDYETQLRYTFGSLKEACAAVPAYTVTGFPDADSVSEILFSTGTTGKEKGIVLNHSNNIALAENVIHGVRMEKLSGDRYF